MKEANIIVEDHEKHNNSMSWIFELRMTRGDQLKTLIAQENSNQDEF